MPTLAQQAARLVDQAHHDLRVRNSINRLIVPGAQPQSYDVGMSAHHSGLSSTSSARVEGDTRRDTRTSDATQVALAAVASIAPGRVSLLKHYPLRSTIRGRLTKYAGPRKSGPRSIPPTRRLGAGGIGQGREGYVARGKG